MSDFEPKNAVRIQNDSGMDIPPRSVVMVTYDEVTAATDTSESVVITHVKQYDGGSGNILVTGLATISAAATVDSSFQTEGWWSPNNSYGLAYADQRLVVAIDESIELPFSGEEWGPKTGEWYITRGGRGFYADGYYASTGSVGSSSGGSSGANGVDGNGGLANVDQSLAIFMRGSQLKKHWAKITSTLNPGTLESPTSCQVNVWLPDITSGATPIPYVVATDPSLLGLTVTNRGCFSNTLSSSSSSSVAPGTVCRIEYDNDAAEWYLAWIGRCTQVVKSVSCSGNSLTVTYGSITG